MQYEFEDEEGNSFLVDFPMGKAPGEPGDWVTLPGGLRARRLLPTLSPPNVPADRHFESTSMPRWYPFHRQAGGEFSPDGKPRFESWKQVEETVKRANAHGEGLVYEGEREIS